MHAPARAETRRSRTEDDPLLVAIEAHWKACRERESVRRDPAHGGGLVAPIELLDARIPRDPPTARPLEGLEGLLAVTRADLVHVRVEDLGGARGVAIRPHEDTLGPHVHVDARVVPVEEAPHPLRRVHFLGGGEVLTALAPVALTVGHKVAVVDVRGPLDEHLDAGIDPGARGVREQQRDLGVALRVERLLRVADPRRYVDARCAVLVVGSDRPHDRLLPGIDRHVLARDELPERLADLLGQAGGHGPIYSSPVSSRARRAARSGARDPCRRPVASRARLRGPGPPPGPPPSSSTGAAPRDA